VKHLIQEAAELAAGDVDDAHAVLEGILVQASVLVPVLHTIRHPFKKYYTLIQPAIHPERVIPVVLVSHK
jgi:hypothetical protein